MGRNYSQAKQPTPILQEDGGVLHVQMVDLHGQQTRNRGHSGADGHRDLGAVAFYQKIDVPANVPLVRVVRLLVGLVAPPTPNLVKKKHPMSGFHQRLDHTAAQVPIGTPDRLRVRLTKSIGAAVRSVPFPRTTNPTSRG
jgi:hypothetical protein